MRTMARVAVVCLAVAAFNGLAWASAAGTYSYTLSWDDMGSRAKVTYALMLGQQGTATLEISPSGRLDYDRQDENRYGEVFDIIRNGSTVMQRGEWSGRGSDVRINFREMRTGRGDWRKQSFSLFGNTYSDDLFLSEWDTRFYGHAPTFNFTRTHKGDGSVHEGDGNSTKTAIIAGAVLVGLGLLAHHGDDDSSSDETANLKQQLQKRLSAFADAMERHDWRAMTSAMPADFRYYDFHGNELDKGLWGIRLRDLEDILVNPNVTMALGDLDKGAAQASGVVTTTIESRMTGENRDVQLKAVEKDRVYWEQRGSKWVTVSVRVLSVEQWIDGKRVGGVGLL